MLKEFRDFAMRGNVVDLAVGVVIGGAFGKIVTSLVNDIIMPPLGLLLGKVDFSSLFISLNGNAYPSVAAAKAAGAPTLNYGIFINAILDFILVAAAIFFIVRMMNRLRQQPAPAPTARECPQCLLTVPRKATRCAHCTSELPPVL